MAKFVLSLAIFVSVVMTVTSDVNDNEVIQMYGGVPAYKLDPECAMLGGLCVHKSDCLQRTSSSGLCPSNQHQGVECCYELPLRPAPCKQHQGACMPRCNRRLQKPATDCADGEVCCVLVH